jgi:hypothetical protein
MATIHAVTFRYYTLKLTRDSLSQGLTKSSLYNDLMMLRWRVNSTDFFQQQKNAPYETEGAVVLPNHSATNIRNSNNETFKNTCCCERTHYIEDNHYGRVYTRNNGA